MCWPTLCLRLLILAAFSAAVPSSGFASEVTPVEDYLTKNLTTDEGLPMNQLNYIDISKKGFLWIATFEGLIRYDGHEFQTITHNDYTPLKGGVFDIKIDRDDVLWAFDTNHRYLFRVKEGAITHWETDRYTKVVDYTLFTNWDGDVVFLGGDTFYTIKDEQIVEFPIDGLKGISVHDALFAKDGSLWVADAERRVHRIRNGQVQTFDPENYGASSGRVVNLEQGADFSIWAVTSENELLHYSAGSWDFFHNDELTASGPTRDLLAEDNGSLWIGTQAGMFRFSEGEIEALPSTPHQDADHIFSIVPTPEGNIAYSTFNNGLKLLQKRTFKAYTPQHGLKRGVFRAVVPSPDGNFLIGSTEGVARIDPSTDAVETVFPELANVDITDIVFKEDGHIYFSSYGQGLYEYADGRMRRYTQEDGLPSDTVYQLELLPDGRLALGTYAGLGFFDGTRFEKISVEDGLASNIVLSLFVDDSGGLLCSLASGGLSRYKNGALESMTKGTSLENATVFHLSKDRQGTIWGGYSGGVFRIQPGSGLEIFDLTGNFPRANIFHVWNDSQGNVWLTSNSGLYRVDNQWFNAEDSELKEGDNFQRYLKTDGLPSNNVTALSGAHAEDDVFWIPFNGGIVKLEPARADLTLADPTVYIDQIRANSEYLKNYPFLETEPIQFEPGLRYLRIRYSAPSFHADNRTSFIYRLQGFEEWQQASGHEAVYTNLPPGTYTFEVAYGTLDDLEADPQTARVTFTLEPYFYQTVWFYLLVAGALVLFGFGINFLRLRASRRSEERLEALVEARTHELRRQSEELKMAKEHAESASRLKSEFTAKISHEIRTPMNSIIGFTDILRHEIKDPAQKDYLETIYKSGTTLTHMIDDLLDLSMIEAHKLSLIYSNCDLVAECRESLQMLSPKINAKGITLHFSADTKIPEVIRIDPVRFRQIILNIVGNAVKFTDHGEIRVELKMTRRERSTVGIECIVNDTGQGIPEPMLERIFNAFEQASRDYTRPDTGSGLGLAISRRLAELMGGSLSVESELGKGSSFTIHFPDLRVGEGKARGKGRDAAATQMTVTQQPKHLDECPSVDWLWHMLQSPELDADEKAQLHDLIREKLIPALTTVDSDALQNFISQSKELCSGKPDITEMLEKLYHVIRNYMERIDIKGSRQLRDSLEKALQTN